VFRTVRRVLRAAGVYEPLPTAGSITDAGTRPRVVSYKYMEHAESSRILRALISRRARLLFIYAGGQHDSFNHPGQLKRMFPGVAFEGRVAVERFAQMDHTQMFASDRRAVVDAIERWIARPSGVRIAPARKPGHP
jgi:hypothetical protein